MRIATGLDVRLSTVAVVSQGPPESTQRNTDSRACDPSGLIRKATASAAPRPLASGKKVPAPLLRMQSDPPRLQHRGWLRSTLPDRARFPAASDTGSGLVPRKTIAPTAPYLCCRERRLHRSQIRSGNQADGIRRKRPPRARLATEKIFTSFRSVSPQSLRGLSRSPFAICVYRHHAFRRLDPPCITKR
jgi:hypothetical protein